MMSAISRAAATSFSRGQGEASLTSFAAAPGSNANSNFGRAERFPRAQNIAEADTNDGYVQLISASVAWELLASITTRPTIGYSFKPRPALGLVELARAWPGLNDVAATRLAGHPPHDHLRTLRKLESLVAQMDADYEAFGTLVVP
jgi:hypothetical protein